MKENGGKSDLGLFYRECRGDYKNEMGKSGLKRQIKLTHLITRNFVIDTNYVNQLVCIAHVRAATIGYNSVNSNEGK